MACDEENFPDFVVDADVEHFLKLTRISETKQAPLFGKYTNWKYGDPSEPTTTTAATSEIIGHGNEDKDNDNNNKKKSDADKQREAKQYTLANIQSLAQDIAYAQTKNGDAFFDRAQHNEQ